MKTRPLNILSAITRPSAREVALTPEIELLLAAGAPVAIGVSGGKDSTAVALATIEHLDAVGHRGERLLVHADLGVTEWADSLPSCQRLADHLGLELLVVRRSQGDMMDRWEQRWRDNAARWASLSCVKIILPWSTASMRFCTSELKVDQITRALKRHFSGQTIINVTGIRRDESNDRRNAPFAQRQVKLYSSLRRTDGWDWNAIAHWSLSDVLNIAEERGVGRHEGYTRFGSRRISCVYCILATEADHRASATDARNVPVGLRIVDLEIASTFAFQGKRWLGDTLFDHLSPLQRNGLEEAKARAARRIAAEDCIPRDLLYTKGWPTRVPTIPEAEILASVRRTVAEIIGIDAQFTTLDAVRDRYRVLMELKRSKRKSRAAEVTS